MATPPETPDPPRPRRGVPLIAIGAAVALVAGLGIAWVLVGGDDGSGAAPPAAESGLVIDSSAVEDGRIDPGKPLRCFVQGRFAGELSLTECAQRNGVATDALDVGLDETGALAAADQAGQTLTPLPPIEEEPAELPDPVGQAEFAEPGQVVAMPAGSACWRHGGGRWRRLGDMDLNACVQTLYAGRCERAGGAAYGRFGQQTLRLVAGRVEISDDNKSFRTLAPQAPDCSLPPVG